jgi:hypothetical protein
VGDDQLRHDARRLRAKPLFLEPLSEIDMFQAGRRLSPKFAEIARKGVARICYQAVVLMGNCIVGKSIAMTRKYKMAREVCLMKVDGKVGLWTRFHARLT